ncbi:histone protein [Streptomyces sp. NPDC006446]|uniref:histone protein n=1 Tax=Streptomyces sp. NPDC006446 TaxID=3154301 RepID=UPI0033A5BDF1
MDGKGKVVLAAAVVGGYVLGRTKKGRLALSIATYLAGRRFGLEPRQLAAEGMRRLGEIPQVAELQEQLRGEVLEAGRKAMSAAADRGMATLADSLSDRTSRLLEMPDEAEEEYAPEDEDAEYEEEEEPEAEYGEDQAEEEEEEPEGEYEEEEPEEGPEAKPRSRRSSRSDRSRKASAPAAREKTAPGGGEKSRAAKKTAPAKRTAAKKTAAKKTAPAKKSAARKTESSKRAASKRADRRR